MYSWLSFAILGIRPSISFLVFTSNMNLFIIRHGQDEDNKNRILNGHRDTLLTPTGLEQARQAGRKLQAYPIDLIYTSPLRRAMATAAIIGEQLGLPQEVLPELIERDFGVFTGTPIDDIAKNAQKVLVTPQVTFFLDGEGVETFPELYERAGRLLVKLQENHPHDNIALVTHGDMAKMLQAVFHGWDWEYALRTPYLANTEILELSSLLEPSG